MTFSIFQVKTSMLRAYLLALFSHMVAKLVGDLYFSLHGPEAMSDLFESEAKVIEEGDPEPESEKDEDDPSPVKSEAQPQKKKKFKDFFRRRRRRSSSSSDESEKRRDTTSSTSEDSSEDEAEPRGKQFSIPLFTAYYCGFPIEAIFITRSLLYFREKGLFRVRELQVVE